MPTPATRLGQCTGPLAQSVEQKTFNLLVVGSNPTRPTNCINDLGALAAPFSYFRKKLSGSTLEHVRLMRRLNHRQFVVVSLSHLFGEVTTCGLAAAFGDAPML